MSGHTVAPVLMSEKSLWEVALSLHCVGSRERIQDIRLGGKTLTCWAISHLLVDQFLNNIFHHFQMIFVISLVVPCSIYMKISINFFKLCCSCFGNYYTLLIPVVKTPPGTYFVRTRWWKSLQTHLVEVLLIVRSFEAFLTRCQRTSIHPI